MTNKELADAAQKTLSRALVRKVEGATKRHSHSTLAIAEAVFQAKTELSNEYFESFVEAISHYVDRSKVRKLKRIGESAPRLRQYIDSLPFRWTTLYQLSQSGDDELRILMETGKVHSLATWAELKTLLGLSKSKPARRPFRFNYRFKLDNVADSQRPRFLGELKALCDKFGVPWTEPSLNALEGDPHFVPNGTADGCAP